MYSASNLSGLLIDELRVSYTNIFDEDIVFTALNLTAEPVPEPRTLVLFGFGLLGLGFARRKRAA